MGSRNNTKQTTAENENESTSKRPSVREEENEKDLKTNLYIYKRSLEEY